MLKDDRSELKHALIIESTTSLHAAAKLDAHKLEKVQQQYHPPTQPPMQQQQPITYGSLV